MAEMLNELFADPRTYALGVAMLGWIWERQRTKELAQQLTNTLEKLQEALSAGGG